MLCWLSYKNHFDDDGADSATKLAVFRPDPRSGTPPGTWSPRSSERSSVFAILGMIAGSTGDVGYPGSLGFLVVPFIVVVIGTSLGGPTGYAINPARDLGPRIAHFVLPFRGKGDSDWAYPGLVVASSGASLVA